MKDSSGREDAAVVRPRRLRYGRSLREMVRETELSARNLVYPLFVAEGIEGRRAVDSMPGISQLPLGDLEREAHEILELGIPAVLLFGIPASKDSEGTESYAEDGIVQRAIQVIKKSAPGLEVITDVCLCEYTDHGHCGILNLGERTRRELPDGYLMNDETLEVLARIALSHARAGADIVAPSGMIDGMVRAIRAELDVTGHEMVSVMSYSVKYASAFYGPFREAAQGAPKFGDRRSHQMDPANKREALREARIDVEEGADFLMVKPALSYLDVIAALRAAQPELPLVAYNVSGEYSMIKAASARGWIDERSAAMEVLTSIRRAGADLIITYFAKEAAGWLRTDL
ncbi:MAG TPA: porphobilinogen synthase [Spirochaetia bacterium]|nr:porphobilinogen synthase [Spirochaetia bacterium]